MVVLELDSELEGHYAVRIGILGVKRLDAIEVSRMDSFHYTSRLTLEPN